MKTTAIVQARMGSTRLPGKVLKDICGRTMLARVVRRAKRTASLDGVAVATTVLPADDEIEKECERLGVRCFRGSSEDVLDRYYLAARTIGAEVIVRVTADCPLVEPEVIDLVLSRFAKELPDYASNVIDRTYPIGLDVEAISISSLVRAWKEASEDYQRIHVTPYLYQNPAIFRLLSITDSTDRSDFRWTVDTPEDLNFVREIYSRLGGGDAFTWRDVLKLLEREPDLAELNRHVRQKSIHEG